MAVSATAEMGVCVSPSLNKAEIRQVQRHQAHLSEQRGSMVGLEEAQEDWLSHHAQTWRQERQSEVLGLQLEEIRKHKWIESEKAHRDLGSEAVLDWIKNHAARWRAWYERQHDGDDENS